MKKLLLALALCFISSAAFAQCNGVFPATTVCGNLGPSPAPPHAITATTSIFGPGTTTTSGDIPYWSNVTGTQLGDTGVPIFPIKMYGAPCNGIGDDEPAIASAVASAAIANQGEQAKVLLCKTVHLNEGYNLTVSNVRIVGLGSGFNSDNCINAGTTITMSGAGGIPFTISTPVSGTSNTSINGGFGGFCINGQGTVGNAIRVTSRLGFWLYDISFSETTSAGLYFNTQATSATTFGNQSSEVGFIYCAQVSTTGACVSLDGTATIGNTSINDWHDFQFSINNGNGFELHSADTNVIRHVRSFATGTGAPVKFFGSNVSNTLAAYNNIIEGLSANTAAIFDNTSTYPATYNSIIWMDAANSTPIPQLTGGGNVYLPYGYYSYNNSLLASLNGCPLTYVTSAIIQYNCAFDYIANAWSYLSYSAVGVLPVPTNGIHAFGDNYASAAEIDDVNTFIGATKSFQHYQMTPATSMYLLDTLTTSGYVVNGTLGTAGYSIANLPPCTSGYVGNMAYVTNGASPVTFNQVVVTGATSAYTWPVFCGTNPTSPSLYAWTYH